MGRSRYSGRLAGSFDLQLSPASGCGLRFGGQQPDVEARGSPAAADHDHQMVHGCDASDLHVIKGGKTGDQDQKRRCARMCPVPTNLSYCHRFGAICGFCQSNLSRVFRPSAWPAGCAADFSINRPLMNRPDWTLLAASTSHHILASAGLVIAPRAGARPRADGAVTAFPRSSVVPLSAAPSSPSGPRLTSGAGPDPARSRCARRAPACARCCGWVRACSRLAVTVTASTARITARDTAVGMAGTAVDTSSCTKTRISLTPMKARMTASPSVR